MKPKTYKLTKSKIASGIQCKKKLWFDIHEPAKKVKKATFQRGERFNEVIRKHYTKIHGKELNLTGIWDDLIVKTKDAINSKEINVIYEGTFEYLDTQVRTDVLIRKKKGWELLEAKSSTRLKDEHIPDISIQSFIVRECLKQIGHNLISCKLIHINKDFTLENTEDYTDLINDENDISNKIIEIEKEIPNYIKDLLPLTEENSPCPEIEMGTHCNKPNECNYKDRCEKSFLKKFLLPKSDVTPFTILPYVGKLTLKDRELIEFMKNQGTVDLQKVPSKYFRNRKGYPENYHQIIQVAHKNNEPWFNFPGLKNAFKKFSFPFYFMDFEYVDQGVPIVKNTKPYVKLPFQWSVHKWESENSEIDKGKSFLRFADQDIERKFIESLLEAVGKSGTIFAHNIASAEVKILNDLKEKDNCKDLVSKIDKLIERIEDSLILARMNFYSPLMNGDWGIKSIIKAIPKCPVNYDGKDNIAGGDDAQLAWFVYTNPKTEVKVRENQKKFLIDYCSKDTLAAYYLIKYLMEKTKNNFRLKDKEIENIPKEVEEKD